MMSALYLQVSIISQALIFVMRSRGWCFIEMPVRLLCAAFIVAHILWPLWWRCTPTIRFAHIHDVRWGWAGAISSYSAVAAQHV
ncbi:plasma membrane ATPase-like [Panicum miliaceum]|uniref:Plasma membrane ATPase-like n=1 Tax=Panicum miliaceum TaxID=4540 RepID=A0A3L6RKG9_PANMI|nr:plasma membrane ATPase-like [Panicum miliaceum]